MAEVSGSAPLRGTSYPAIRSLEQTAQEGATARSARLFNRELGKLNRLQRAAQQKGEVVTEAGIDLEFEPQGPKLVAKSASTSFRSEEPTRTLVETNVEESRPAPADPAAARSQAEATPPAVVTVRGEVAERVSKLNQTLNRVTQPAPPTQSADPSLDATA